MTDPRIQLTVPEYYKKFINSKIDLTETSKVCCPFHSEDTPSFSYNASTSKWRCFGSCKAGGGVVDLHRMNYKLKSNSEAEKSLCKVLGIPIQKISSIDHLNEPVVIDDESVELDRIYNLCNLHANNIDRWVDMDYVMSIYPVDITRLKDMLNDWGINYK